VLDPAHPEVAATRGVNHTDNTEVVEITNAPAGSYKVVVSGTSVTANSPQQFVVVATADLGSALVPCVNPFAGNNSQSSAYGNVVSTQSLMGRTCEQTTSSFFKFLVDKAGTVSVTVTATDTPVRVTLSSGATQTATVDVPAGTTRTVSTTYTGSTATTFFARVEANGTVGSAARYTITPTFPNVQHTKRRAARRG
jgi:hypothetical protein